MEKTKIDKMWDEAIRLFQNLTGQSLGSSPVDLRKRIEDRAAEKGNQEATDTALKILDCVKLLGGVVAQATSIVFGPSELCFSAISVLLDVPRKIKDFNDIIDSVFDSIEPVLSQYKIYSEIEQFKSMDNELLIATHKVLIGLVTICARVINLEKTKKWAKLKKFTSAVTCGNEDLKQELEKFQSLIENQQIVQGAVMLETVLRNKNDLTTLLMTTRASKVAIDDVNAKLKRLVEAEGSRDSDKARKTRIEDIKDRLGLKGATDPSIAVMEDITKKTHPSIEKWFAAVQQFNDWANCESPETGSLLLLTGVPGSGKSFSTSAIINHLENTFTARKQQTRRCLVGYHFFPPPSRKLDDEDNLKLVNTALKWIAIQLAEQDEAYAKQLAHICSSKDRNGQLFRQTKAEDLWNTLNLGEPLPMTTHYIFFDGVDGLPEASVGELHGLFKTLHPSVSDRYSSVRVLATGTGDTFDWELINWLSCPVIGLEEEHFRTEVAVYIKQKLETEGMLPGKALAGWRQKIAATLTELPALNFRIIQTVLDRVKKLVASSRPAKDLDQVLQNLTSDDGVISRETLVKLEEELEPNEIDLANELIAWVESPGSAGLTVNSLEAALFLREIDLPVRGLGSFIDTSLKTLLEIDPNGVVRLQVGMADVFWKEKDMSQPSGPPTISLELKITNADIPTVKRFFWDLTKFAALDNFVFINQMSHPDSISLKRSLGLNRMDADLTIVKSAIKFLQALPHPGTEALGDHLVACFPYHLEWVLRYAGELDENGKLEEDYKHDIKDVGQFVFELFDKPGIIRRHWGTSKWAATAILGRRSLGAFWNCLENDHVFSSLNRQQQKWVRSMKRQPHHKHRLFQPVVTMAAKLWLRSSEGYAADAFGWVREYLLLCTLLVGEVAWEYPIFPFHDLSVQITTAETWCKEKLQAEQDSLWYMRLGQTFHFWARNYREAASCYRKAMECGEKSWEVFNNLADALTSDRLMLESCSTLEDALKVHDDSSDVSNQEKARVLRNMASAHRDFAHRTTKVEECYIRALQADKDDIEARGGLISVCAILDKEDDARDSIVAAAAAKPNGNDGEKAVSLLGLIVVFLSEVTFDVWWEWQFWRILSIPLPVDIHTILLEDIDIAIVQAQSNSKHFSRCILLLYRGLIQFSLNWLRLDLAPTSDPAFLKSWDDALEIAQRDIPQAAGELSIICSRSLMLSAIHHLDQTLLYHKQLKSAETKTSASHAQLATLNDLERLQSLDREDERIRGGGISTVKCYLASYHVVTGNCEGARDVFASEMKRVGKMLSNNDMTDDKEGLNRLSSILIHSGDLKNGYVALRITATGAPTILSENLRDVLLELFRFGEDIQIRDESPAARLLTFFDSNCSSQKDMVSNLRILISEAEKLAETVDTKTGSDVIPDQLDGGVDEPTTETPGAIDADKEFPDGMDEKKLEGRDAVQSVLPNKGLPAIADKHSSEMSYWEIADMLKRLEGTVGDEAISCCSRCYMQRWDVGSDFFRCKYCRSVSLCKGCMEYLKSNKGASQIRICRPTHDWVRMPKMTPKLWAESFMGVVRIPTGTDDEGNFIDGDSDKTVSASTWLRGVMKSWDIELEHCDLDSESHGTPPSPPYLYDKPPPPLPEISIDESFHHDYTTSDAGNESPRTQATVDEHVPSLLDSFSLEDEEGESSELDGEDDPDAGGGLTLLSPADARPLVG